MILAQSIRSLRDRATAELGAVHDYFADTQIAWTIVEEAVQGGRTFANTNRVTGTRTTESELVAKSQNYAEALILEATFQQFVSIFESFAFDFLRLWLLAYPQNLIGKTVEFKSVLEAPDKEAITLEVVDRELNGILYKRPAEWFAYIEERIKIGRPTADEIDRFAEAKAARDALVHSRGIAGKAYAAKAGKYSRCEIGDRIEITEPYHREVWDLLRKLVADVSDGAAAKFV